MAAKHVERRDPVAGKSLGACEDPVWCEEERVMEEFVMEQSVPPYFFAFAVGELGFREVGPRTRVYAEAVSGVLDVASREFAGTEEMIMVEERLFGPYEWERFGLLPLQLQSCFLERKSACSPNLRFNGENGWNLSIGTYDAYFFKR
ncbi:Leukotriene A-4 hydrolase-like protein [Forsythia ovata]|uniref:Leukotriene A-4 hydrolase-like protein n=1 Tax=Forsythia ovata TaxID=205694 RepID=A0ABD1W7A5_9LAMI